MNEVMIKETLEGVIVKSKFHLGGEQYIFRFSNDYGASVIRNPYSYGGDKGLWELAVVKFYGDGDDDWDINYDTDITDDVLGWLTDEDVLETLKRIKKL